MDRDSWRCHPSVVGRRSSVVGRRRIHDAWPAFPAAPNTRLNNQQEAGGGRSLLARRDKKGAPAVGDLDDAIHNYDRSKQWERDWWAAREAPFEYPPALQQLIGEFLARGLRPDGERSLGRSKR